MAVEELDWIPSTSILEAINMSAVQLRSYCSQLLGKVESAAESSDISSHMHPSNMAIWLVGLTCVTLISMCAAIGILFVKGLSKQTYNNFITVFVAVGVGSLITSSTLHLLPQGLGLVDGKNFEFITEMMFCIFGIYTFFFCDKFIKITLESKKRNEIEMTDLHTHPHSDVGIKSIRSTDALIANVQPPPRQIAGNLKQCDTSSSDQTSKQFKKTSYPKKQSSIGENPVGASYDMSNQAHGICVHDHDITFNNTKDSAIKTVAWMIVFGDGLHNFIDGISIGAAISESILSGLSVSLAVLAEEFPHELGDVAILLHAGMNLRQALFYNLLSTVTCFIGFTIGVLLGSVESFLRYIFGFSGGMFLYIALSCMMPEMKKTMEEALENGYGDALIVLSLQTAGLAVGTFAMFFFARFGDAISF